jgi:uncharacterized spore protein YtfJ
LKVSPWETETRILVGAALRAGDRLLYPVLKVEVVHSKGYLIGLWIIPLAVLVIEPGREYLVSLRKEDEGAEELADIAPPLEALVEEAKRAHNIDKMDFLKP